MNIRGLRILALFGGLAALAMLSGCFETTQEFTLNPDGSGKVVHESTFQSLDLAGGQRPAEAQLRAAAAEIIRQAKGVEAWRDVSFNLQDDGRMHFKGTAYFRKLSDLELPNQTMLEFNWTAGPDGTAALTLRERKQDKPAKPGPDLKKLAPAERARLAKEARAKYQQAKPMMTMILGAMKHEVVFHLPGQRKDSAVFTEDPAGTLRLQFDGARILATMETLVNNDEWIARNVDGFGAEGGLPAGEDASLLLFGSKRPASATVAGLRGAQFDYEAELAAARADFTGIAGTEGAMAATPSAAPAQSGVLKGVRLVGMRIVDALDERLELQPFGSAAGYTLALLAELDGSVHTVSDESMLDTAIAGDGSDLLPESEFNRRFHFPKLSADKTSVLVEAELRTPPAGVPSIKELTGHLRYTVAGAPSETDLGFSRISVGAKGKALGAEVVAIANEKGAGRTVDLHLLIEPDSLKALFLVRGKTKTELDRRGYGGGNGDYTFTYYSEAGFPPGSKLVAEIYGDLQAFDAPFQLQNIPLPALR